MAPPPTPSQKTAEQKMAERLAEENASMKREAVEQEERLKRLHAKIQKMEQDMAGLLRKRGTVGQGAAASAAAKGARDVEVDKLDVAIHEQQFQIDAINKQLLIIKHTAPGAARKQLSSIYGTDHGRRSSVSAYGAPVPARRPQSAAGGKKTALLSDTTESDLREIINTLKRECTSATERLREAQSKAEAQLITGGTADRDRVRENKTVEELRAAVRDIKSKTTLLEATEEQRRLACKNVKEAVERTDSIMRRFKDEHGELQRNLVDLIHQKKLVELRKVEHDEITAQIVKARVEQDELEEENRRLRSVAFSAGEVILTVTQLGNEQQQLSELAANNKKQLEELSTRNVASEKALAELESDAENSISRLELRDKDYAAKAKLMTREIASLREKLSTFIGHDGTSGRMDQSSVREARLLAQRMGVPMYMRVASTNASDADQSLDDMRREIRRLKVMQASELREIGKLRQMVHTQEHLMRHTVAGGAEGEKELARINRVHNNKVAALQRRISEMENKNEHLRQLLAQSRVDKLANVADSETLARSKSTQDVDDFMVVRHEQLVAGRGVVSVTVEGLVLNKEYGDFSRNEPTTLLVLDFYLHDIQNSGPMRGLAPEGTLRRDFEVSLDDVFLHFLYFETLQIQLVLVRGLDFATIAQAAVPLRPLIESARADRLPRMNLLRVQLLSAESESKTSSLKTGAAGVGRQSVGYVNLAVQVQARIAEQARQFISRQEEAVSSPASTFTRIASASAADKAREKTTLLEEFPRHVGCTYVLMVKLISISDIATMPARRSTTASAEAPRTRRRFLAMHQLLDFPVNETDTISVVEGSQASLFAAGAAKYKMPANPDWDRRLLAGRLEMVLLDQSDPNDDLVGTAELMLAPMISRRGVTATVPLYDAGGQVSAYIAVEVAWEPEPIFESIGGLTARELDAIQERLTVIRTWIKYMGLGDLEAATKALYESWENNNADIAAEGVARTQWVGILREMRDGAAKEAALKGLTLQSITEAEMVATFNYIIGQHSSASDGGVASLAGRHATGAGAGTAGQSSKLQKLQFVRAIAFESSGGAGHGGAGSRQVTGGSSRDRSVEAVAAVQAAPEAMKAPSSSRVSSSGGGADSADAGDGRALRVRVEAVTCLELLQSAAQQCKELAIRARCLGGKFAAKTAAYTSQPFDNSAIAGGFVAWAAEWAQKVGERHQIELALADATSVPEDVCLELELCRVSGDVQKANVAAGEGASEGEGLAPFTWADVDSAGAALPPPDIDLVIGVWRLPLSDLTISGDLKAFAATVKAVAPLAGIKTGDTIAELHIDVTGSALISSMAR